MSNNKQYYESERIKALNMYKELCSEQRVVQSIISNLHGEIKGTGLLYSRDVVDGDSVQFMLKCKFHTIKNKLDDLIFKKELLKKDIGILQYRISYLENELRKAKPWWRKFI